MLRLSDITDFHEYIATLQNYKNNHLIIFAVKDALATSDEKGPFYPHPEAVFEEIASIGFKTNLHGSFRKSFVAVIENGVCLYERLAYSERESVCYEGNEILVRSSGLFCGDFCSIRIENEEYATNDIGLNIVVYDCVRNKLVDSVSVNMLQQKIFLSRKRCTMPKNYRFRLESIHAAGSSVAMFAKEQKMKHIGLYVEKKRKDDFVFEVFQSILLDIGMVDYWVSDEEFSISFGPYKNIFFQKFDKLSMEEDAHLLVFGDMPISAFLSLKCKKIELNKILPDIERYVFWERYMQEFKNLHPDVTVVTVEFPVFPRENHSKNELLILECQKDNRRMEAIYSNYSELGYDKEAVDEMFYRPQNRVMVDDSYYFDDFTNRCITIRDGHRCTPGGRNTGGKCIYFVGECFLFGYGSDDRHTIEAYLQQSLDKMNLNISVQNYGMFCWGIGDNSYKKIFDLPIKPGDLVIINIIGKPKFFECPNLDLTELFQRPHMYGDNLFIDTLLHYNKKGNKIIADKIYQYLEGHNYFEKNRDLPKRILRVPQFGIKYKEQSIVNTEKRDFRTKIIQMHPELESYGESLASMRPKIGSIVMNCNPFTLGHRFLIETASKECAYVFVFVVEEDKSEFCFNDRIEIVRRGVSDLTNVKVIPSGNFIISSVTFEEYFGKAKLQNKKIDTSFDVKIFAEFIAPALGINVRFVGEEPEDTVTRQYNESMAEILPRHGIELKVMPRKQDDEGYISAGRVRRALRAGEMGIMRKLLPATTYDYIQDVKTGTALREKLLSRGALLVETHQAYLGWHEAVFEGITSGDVTKDWALEAVRLHFSSPVGKLSYRVFGADHKWGPMAGEGAMAGSVGRARPLYGIAIGLESETFHVKYRVHVIGHGWSQWAKDGAGLMTKYPLNGLQVIVG